jgi:uncharacterized protein YndB with AHSA1/START domain
MSTTQEKTKITVTATVQAPVETVWACWTEPQHITKWCFASEDWHAPRAENDLQVGGRFVTRMEAKDGSFGFEFGGIYTEVKPLETIHYTMDDDRTCEIVFEIQGDATHVVEIFEAESQNPVEMQQFGWQAILNNFKTYVESLNA